MELIAEAISVGEAIVTVGGMAFTAFLLWFMHR